MWNFGGEEKCIQSLVGKYEGKKQFGILWGGLEDIIKMDFKNGTD
jgi:hypothetical protein